MYKITKKFERGPEMQIGVYKTMTEAKKIIQQKLAEDVAQKVKAVYCLYEGMDLMEEFDISKLEAPEPSEEQESQGAGQGAGQRFSPTPLNMTPQPKGLPRSWVKDEENKDGKK
jgi:hypothetical protein